MPPLIPPDLLPRAASCLTTPRSVWNGPIAILDGHPVRSARIGRLWRACNGLPHMMADADNTSARGTVPQVGREAYAESVPESVPFECSPSALVRAELCNLVTPERCSAAIAGAGSSSANNSSV